MSENAAKQAERSIGKSQRFKNFALENFPLLGFVLITAFLGIVTKGTLFSQYNLKTMGNQIFLYILGGFGCLFLFAQGGIDLSMAANVGMAAIIGARVMQVNVVLGVVAAILCATVVGVVLGYIYAYAGISVFVVGLGMNFLLNGVLNPLCAGQSSISAPPSLTGLKSNLGELIILVIALAVILLTYNFTKFGRECRAIGAGEVSTIQSGVNVKKNKVLAFVITGFTCGLVAVLTLIRTGAASTTTGANFNFNVMTALILGGCSTEGGAGVKVRNAILGALILIVLQNGLVLSGVNTRIQEIVKGVLFILMIVLSAKFLSKVNK